MSSPCPFLASHLHCLATFLCLFFSTLLSLSFCTLFSPSLSHSRKRLIHAFLCQMSFYLSQQSLSAQGRFRVYIGKRVKTNTKRPGNRASRGICVIVISLFYVVVLLTLLFLQFLTSSLPLAQIRIVCGDLITGKAEERVWFFRTSRYSAFHMCD